MDLSEQTTAARKAAVAAVAAFVAAAARESAADCGDDVSEYEFDTHAVGAWCSGMFRQVAAAVPDLLTQR